MAMYKDLAIDYDQVSPQEFWELHKANKRIIKFTYDQNGKEIYYLKTRTTATPVLNKPKQIKRRKQ